MKISVNLHQSKIATMTAMQTERLDWWSHWRDLADFILPKRYIWLLSDKESKTRLSKNPNILDATGTNAARTLASGMMNGITSPSRPWFKLRIPGFMEDESSEAQIWLDEVLRRMMLVMAESNFYNAIAVMYLDLVVFGTSALLIYEDYESTIRCYNCALGEFYLAQSDRLQVNTFARDFKYKVHQVVEWWGIENCSDRVKTAWNAQGARLQEDVKIAHLIEPNVGPDKLVPKSFTYREFFWEMNGTKGEVLAVQGYNELPGIFPRWELSGNDSYGSSPGMDALGDIIQLQHETKRKGQALDYLVRPPTVSDIQLQHKPTALMPGGNTYVTDVMNKGVKPIYTVNPPLGELTLDIREVQARIQQIFHNDLFRMISNLNTVRSAAEIYELREEKLVLLGPVLERFENEALDPAIKRIFAVMSRSGLIPPAPRAIQNAPIEIEYMSILSAAQAAVAAIPTERFAAFVGEVAGAVPQALNIPNWDELIRDYGRAIGVKSKGINSREQVQALKDQQDKMAADKIAAEQGTQIAAGAKTLSQAEVGGGANALQLMLGG